MLVEAKHVESIQYAAHLFFRTLKLPSHFEGDQGYKELAGCYHSAYLSFKSFAMRAFGNLYVSGDDRALCEKANILKGEAYKNLLAMETARLTQTPYAALIIEARDFACRCYECVAAGYDHIDEPDKAGAARQMPQIIDEAVARTGLASVNACLPPPPAP